MLLPLLRTAFTWPDRAGFLAGASAAPTDVLQYTDRYELHIDLPGVEPNSIKLELSCESGVDNYLVISNVDKVKDKAQVDSESIIWLRRERYASASFLRVFALPGDVDLDKVTAVIDKGVLKVTLPRMKEKQQKPTRRIPLSKL